VRYLILSDIHANWEALRAVIASAGSLYDRVVCCGDLVGYGADPDAVVEWVRTNVSGVIRGNHDKACAGLEDLEWFNPVARLSALWTQAATQPGNIEFLRGLAQGPERINGFQILHGSPLDEDEYVVSEQDVAQVAPYLDCNVSFFGHTHLQGAFLCHRNGVKRMIAANAASGQEVLELENDVTYLINPGSVGQPRDGDRRAAYAIYEPAAGLVSLCRAEYDVASAQKKILDAGLPELLALRLGAGI
jgi:predicted phosphodiesterase